MKKIISIFLLLISSLASACPDCWDYQGKRWLRQEPFGPVDCNCNCAQQYHTTENSKHGYKCLKCNHKLVRKDPENLKITRHG